MNGVGWPLGREAKPRTTLSSWKGTPLRGTTKLKKVESDLTSERRRDSEGTNQEQLTEADLADYCPHTPPKDLMDSLRDNMEEEGEETEEGDHTSKRGHPPSRSPGIPQLALQKAGDGMTHLMPLPYLSAGQTTPRQEAGPRMRYPTNHAEYYTYWAPVKVETSLTTEAFKKWNRTWDPSWNCAGELLGRLSKNNQGLMELPLRSEVRAPHSIKLALQMALKCVIENMGDLTKEWALIQVATAPNCLELREIMDLPPLVITSVHTDVILAKLAQWVYSRASSNPIKQNPAFFQRMSHNRSMVTFKVWNLQKRNQILRNPIKIGEPMAVHPLPPERDQKDPTCLVLFPKENWTKLERVQAWASTIPSQMAPETISQYYSVEMEMMEPKFLLAFSSVEKTAICLEWARTQDTLMELGVLAQCKGPQTKTGKITHTPPNKGVKEKESQKPTKVEKRERKRDRGRSSGSRGKRGDRKKQ